MKERRSTTIDFESVHQLQFIIHGSLKPSSILLYTLAWRLWHHIFHPCQTGTLEIMARPCTIFTPRHSWYRIRHSRDIRDQAPSHFSVCNIEKQEGAWGQGYSTSTDTEEIFMPYIMANICDMIWDLESNSFAVLVSVWKSKLLNSLGVTVNLLSQ